MSGKTLTFGAGWQGRARAFATAHKKTQVDLALAVSEYLGLPEGRTLSRATVGHWMSGRTPPTLPQFLALCQALGADPGYILFERPVLPDMVKSQEIKRALHAAPGETAGHKRLMKSIETKAQTFKRKRRNLRRVRVTS